MEFVCDRGDGGFLLGRPLGEEQYQIYYMELGNVDLLVESRLVHLSGGEICAVLPGQLVRVAGQSAFTNRRTAIGFSEGFLAPFADACGREAVRRLLSCGHCRVLAERREETERLLSRIREPFSPADSLEAFLRRNLVYEYLIGLRRTEPVREAQKADTPRGRIQEAVTYLYESYGERITLADAAGRAGMAPPFFSRQFLKFTGMRFQDYLSYVRLKAARRLLAETGEPVREVARRCGFGESNYFGDTFKKSEGVSPLRYRKNARCGQSRADLRQSKSWER